MEPMWNRIKSVFAASRSPELTTVFSTNTDYEKAFHSPPVCYSDAFPDVPAPVQRSLPELIAAQWISGEIWPEKAPGVAADLLDMGFDTPSMRRLAGEMRVGCRADVEALVLKMLKELGVIAVSGLPYPKGIHSSRRDPKERRPRSSADSVYLS